MAQTNKFRLKFKRSAFRELLHEPKVRAELMARANRIAAQASNNGAVSGYVVTDLVLEEPRGAVSVMATGHAHNHNRKHQALLRAIEAGK